MSRSTSQIQMETGMEMTPLILDYCYAPLGYVAYDPSDEVDCNDNDIEVNPSVPASAEICNGRLDSCDNQWNGVSPPVEEIDADGDGFVACVLDVDPVAWLGDLDLWRR